MAVGGSLASKNLARMLVTPKTSSRFVCTTAKAWADASSLERSMPPAV